MRKIRFVTIAVMGVFALSAFRPIAAMEKYDQVRIKKFPIAMQCWTFRKFSFTETLQKVKDLGIQYLEAYPGQPLGDEMPGVVFNHHLSEEQIRWVKKKLKENGITLVSYGVVNFANEAAEMEKVFTFARKMRIRTIMTEPRYDDFSLLEKMVKKYNVHVAIHNHPLPSKYAMPQTVLFRIAGVDERIGACADTGHWMRSGVNPVEAVWLLQGRIWNVHLKDLNEFGKKEAYDVPYGQGKANIHDILAELSRQNYSGFLTVEYEHEEEAMNPAPSVKKGLEYIRKITYYKEYKQILKSWDGRFNKHGWNHYGPGYFSLDPKTGVLKSHGGMGLFWFSEKKYKDFILELDFKCSTHTTNSGVFLRVPEMPTSDNYVFHSFEIQIDDNGKGIHRTGAIYDAEPPKTHAERPAGEWNHYKISFVGNHIMVELNGKLVIDWDAQPRGKVMDFAPEGYIGLQNHDSISPVYFRNIFVKEL